MHWHWAASEHIYRPRGCQNGMHSMQLPCCMHHPHHMIRRCMAGMQGVSTVITHPNPLNGTKCERYAQADSHTGPSPLSWQPAWDALPSLVRWRIPVAYQWSLTAKWRVSQLVVVCLPHSSRQPGLQVICCSASPPVRCQKYPHSSLQGLWPKCGFDCTLTLTEASVIWRLGLCSK